MASNKYLTASASFTRATRIISSASMNIDFDSGDAGRPCIMRIGTNLYFPYVESYISTTSIKLKDNGELPSSDGTIAELIVFGLSLNHTYQDYIDSINVLVKEETEKLSTFDKEMILKSAVSKYSKDMPFTVKKEVTGDGTNSYLIASKLGGLWVYGESILRNIEYPTGDTPPTILDQNDYYIYDDGTAQDGSNLRIIFPNDTPSTSEKFIVDFTIPRSLSANGQNFPDNEFNFNAICFLAASLSCMILATAFAQSTDSTISADSVQYHEKSRKYTDLARMYLRNYNLMIFGSEDPTSESAEAAMSDKHIDLPSAFDGNTFLFHSP